LTKNRETCLSSLAKTPEFLFILFNFLNQKFKEVFHFFALLAQNNYEFFIQTANSFEYKLILKAFQILKNFQLELNQYQKINLIIRSYFRKLLSEDRKQVVFIELQKYGQELSILSDSF